MKENLLNKHLPGNTVCRDLPESKEHWLQMRTGFITSTEVSILFGLNPRCGILEFWHQKKNRAVRHIEENDFMRWGKRLEPVIAQGIAEDNKLSIIKEDRFYYCEDLRIASSYDYVIENYEGEDMAPMEIKTVDPRAINKTWLVDEDGNVEAPEYIELQIQMELLLMGKDKGMIAVLVGGNTPKLLPRKINPAIVKKILSRVAKFWESIDKDQPPEPDSRDFQFVKDLNADIQEGSVLDAKGNSDFNVLITAFRTADQLEKQYEKEKDEIKAKLAVLTGTHNKVVGDDFSISNFKTPASTYTVERKEGHTFKINLRK